MSSASPHNEASVMRGSRHALPQSAFKPHAIRQGDGQGGWILRPADIQFLAYGDGTKAYFKVPGLGVKPFGVVRMDNDEIIMVGGWDDGKTWRPVRTFSRDNGHSWEEFGLFDETPNASGEPNLLTYLGKGNLMFQMEPIYSEPIVQYFSRDYGRTWPERKPLQLGSHGERFHSEGNALVDRDAHGMATRIAAIGFNYPWSKGTNWPTDPSVGILRWSIDGGRTWINETEPDAWRWQEAYGGKTYNRGTSEGSLVRAANGWLVAALRTDMDPKDNDLKNDNLEGIGVSVSKDDGQTWSPVRRLYYAGRMHPHLLLMPNGDIVMTHIERQDVENGRLASYRRGCGVIISRDNGLTWDMAHRYILDGFDFSDGKQYTLACGHLSSALLDDGYILTCYGNYPAKTVVAIRWKPVSS